MDDIKEIERFSLLLFEIRRQVATEDVVCYEGYRCQLILLK